MPTLLRHFLKLLVYSWRIWLRFNIVPHSGLLGIELYDLGKLASTGGTVFHESATNRATAIMSAWYEDEIDVYIGLIANEAVVDACFRLSGS